MPGAHVCHARRADVRTCCTTPSQLCDSRFASACRSPSEYQPEKVGGEPMEITNLRRWGLGGALIGARALGGGCSGMHEQSWTMSTTDKIPAAIGKVKVQSEDDGNTRVKVEVAHLAKPDSIFDATTYVV